METFLLEISNAFYVLLLLAVSDFVFGVILALINKEFEWTRLTDYLQSNFLPILVWVVIEYLLYLAQDIPDTVDTTVLAGIYGTIFLKLLVSLLGHLARMGILTELLSKVNIE